jgi:hypothetical protein
MSSKIYNLFAKSIVKLVLLYLVINIPIIINTIYTNPPNSLINCVNFLYYLDIEVT